MTEEHKSPKKKTGFIQSISGIFTSVRTTLTLLFLLASASVIGTVIPQTPVPEYHGGSAFLFRLIVILDLHNVYRSWWFVLLLLLLTLNLVGCLSHRVPRIVREWRDSEKAFLRFSFQTNRPASQVHTLVSHIGSEIIGTKPNIVKTNNVETFKWVRHKIYLLGFPLLHSAIILILIGASIGLMYGFRGHVLIKEGESSSQFRTMQGEPKTLPFEIAVDKFTLTRYPTGEPKEFRSDVRLLEGDKEVRKSSIRVNHPLTHHGYSLYQSDYKVIGVRNVTVSVSQDSAIPEKLDIQPRTKLTVPGTETTLQLQSVDPGTTSRGPGVDLAISIPNEAPKSVALFKSTGAQKVGPFTFQFVDFEPLYATGLQISSDPGTPLVWGGSILLILGFCLVLFTSYRRMTVQITDNASGAEITIRGTSHRMRSEFRKAVESKLVSALK